MSQEQPDFLESIAPNINLPEGLANKAKSEKALTLARQGLLQEQKSDDQQKPLLQSNSTVGEAVIALCTQRAVPLPVWDSQKKLWLGILTPIDLVSHLVEVVDTVGPTFAPSGGDSNKDFELRSQAQRKAWSSKEIGTILENSSATATSIQPFVSLNCKYNIWDALRVFVAGCIALPIIDTKNPSELLALISQDDILEFLHTNSQHFQPLLQKKIRELFSDRLNIPVVAVNNNDLLIEAFRKIRDMGVSAVAVMNDDKIDGVISATDVRLIGADGANNAILYRDCSKFVCLLRSIPHEHKPHHVITVSIDEPFNSIIDQMVSNKIHRVFLMDDQQLIGVCSIRDLISKMLIN